MSLINASVFWVKKKKKTQNWVSHPSCVLGAIYRPCVFCCCCSCFCFCFLVQEIEHGGRGRGRENPQQAPCPAQSPTRGSVSRLRSPPEQKSRVGASPTAPPRCPRILFLSTPAPNKELKLKTQRSRVTGSTDWAGQASVLFSVFKTRGNHD